MIPRKKKICKGCQQERYIFSRGLCDNCNKRYKSLSGRLSRSNDGRVPLKGASGKYISPRSDKRIIQEKEYTAICKEIDAEAKETGHLECFFCGDMVVRADHHHLDGRDGDRLTQREWIVRAHRKCHMDYHNKPVSRIVWFNSYLERLKRINERFFFKEIMKLDK